MFSPPSLKDRSKSMASRDVVICVMQFLVAEFDVDVIEDSGLQLVNWYGQNRPLVKSRKLAKLRLRHVYVLSKPSCAGNVLAAWLRCWERDGVGWHLSCYQSNQSLQ